MERSISPTEKRGRGRPRVNPTSIHVTVPPDQLEELDAWIERQAPKPTRPEAVRRLLRKGLAGERVDPGA
jgi:metal-responsive CopG/Arc/MetJ family transcriptional regulator